MNLSTYILLHYVKRCRQIRLHNIVIDNTSEIIFNQYSLKYIHTYMQLDR